MPRLPHIRQPRLQSHRRAQNARPGGRLRPLGVRRRRALQERVQSPDAAQRALTAPYMHNGRFQTLEEVVDFYSNGGGKGEGLQLPNLDDKIRRFKISDQEKRDLIAFLHALTDESKKPEIPEKVPSGLPVVPRLTPKARGSAMLPPPNASTSKVIPPTVGR